MLVELTCDVASETRNSGGNGGDAGDLVMAGGLLYVHSVTPDLKLGISTGSYFGLGVDYGNNWAGGYYTQDAELLTVGVNPVLAYRLSDWLSIGGGFSIIKGNLFQRIAINTIVPFLPDGQLKVEDHDIGYEGNVGRLIESTP